MKVLITGAGGFVCSYLAAGLRNLGHEVTALDRSFDSSTLARLTGCRTLTHNLRLPLEPRPYDLIVHGAATTAAPLEDVQTPAGQLSENTGITLEMLELAARVEARFILLSSAAVFEATSPAPLDEACPSSSLTLYAAAKRMGEIACASLRQEGKLDTLVLRLGNLYGAFETPRLSRPQVSLVQRMVNEAQQEGVITVSQPLQRREWTFVGDLAEAVARLCEPPRFPVPLLHLCAPEVVSESELAAHIAALFSGCTVQERAAAPMPIRPPLESRHAQTLELTDWTPLEQGLRQALENHLERVSA